MRIFWVASARPQSSPPDSKGAGLLKRASYGFLFLALLHVSARQRFLAPLHVFDRQRFLACRAGLCVCDGAACIGAKGQEDTARDAGEAQGDFRITLSVNQRRHMQYRPPSYVHPINLRCDGLSHLRTRDAQQPGTSREMRRGGRPPPGRLPSEWCHLQRLGPRGQIL